MHLLSTSTTFIRFDDGPAQICQESAAQHTPKHNVRGSPTAKGLRTSNKTRRFSEIPSETALWRSPEARLRLLPRMRLLPPEQAAGRQSFLSSQATSIWPTLGASLSLGYLSPCSSALVIPPLDRGFPLGGDCRIVHRHHLRNMH